MRAEQKDISAPDDRAAHGDASGAATASAYAPRIANRSVGETVKALVADVQLLVRGEIALVRAQVRHRIAMIARKSVALVAGVILALIGLSLIFLGLAALLALWVPLWAALLITGFATIATGGLLCWLAVARWSAEDEKPAAAQMTMMVAQ